MRGLPMIRSLRAAVLLSILMLVELLPMSALADSRVVSDPTSGGKFFTKLFVKNR